ncbi:MAG: ABC transporter ATP-binding protein [Spirochaetaceae bacterium]
MDDDKVITGYNPRTARRLLSYLKPHKRVVVVAVIALAFSTVGELLIPVIMQRGVDQHLMTERLRISVEDAGSADLDGVDLSRSVTIGDHLYVLENRLEGLSGARRTDLQERGLLSRRSYYVTDLSADEARRVVADNRNLFVRNEQYAAILFDELETFSDRERRALRHADIEGVTEKSGVFLIVLLGVLAFTFVQIYFMAVSGQRVMRDMRVQLFDHVIRQSLAFLNRNPVGRLVTRLTNDVETINELFTNVLISLLKSFVMMAGVIVTLFLLDFRLALITVATLPPVIIATMLFRGRARDAFRRVRRMVAKVNAFLSEHISGVSVVQLFTQEKRTADEFEGQNRELMRANLGEMYVFATFRPLIDLFSSTSVAVIIYFSASSLLTGVVSLGVVIAFINLIRQFYRQLMEISERFVVLQSAMAGSERIFELLDAVEEIPDNGRRDPGEGIRGKVTFEHVWFSYKENEPVLRDVSFTVNPGETVALVGYTGAGKTTVANLLTRMWDVDEGRITIDGVDIREYTLEGLRTIVQPIQQDVFLFRSTVTENIALGNEDAASMAQQAAATVQADQFVRRLPESYDTGLSEQASNISVGQRQLLSFARALAHDPRIIILDEATSSIDTETERLIQHAMTKLLENRTSLVIAHRLSTIRHADRIIVLAHGEIIEEGNHDELVAADGHYASLYRLQYAEGST